MKWLTPDTMESLVPALAQCTEQSSIIAGGTDYVIKLRQGNADPDLLIYPGQIPELRSITLTEDALRIGAMVTMSELAEALESVSEFRAIADAAAKVGSPQIRNKATMVGNLCNASPAGDMLPVSWLYDAEVDILCGDGSTRRLPIDQFILGANKTALEVGQAVIAVVLPRVRWKGSVSAFRKIGSREHVSISRESMGALLTFAADGTILDARLTLGAVSNIPLRIPEAEALLRGKTLTPDLLAFVTDIVAQTICKNCRPTNRLYKTEAARGLSADLFAKIADRFR